MTLLSQISTLRGQQEALESRLGSLTQTSDSAMDREREAEDRLDAALSLHAKQISQRQVCMHTYLVISLYTFTIMYPPDLTQFFLDKLSSLERQS